MAIDPRIPLMGKHIDLAQIMQDAEARRTARADREWKQSERARDGEVRSSLADYVLSQRAPSQPRNMGGPENIAAANVRAQQATPTGNPAAPAPPSRLGDLLAQGAAPQAAAPQPAAPGQPPAPGQAADPRRTAYERAVRADPEAFLTFEGKRLDLTKKQLDNFTSLNNSAMQLLGGVSDQGSYDAARQAAAQLYERHGEDFNALGLPDQYSPELVQSLRMRGMDTAKQIEAVRRENRDLWDVEDDIWDNERDQADDDADNERADRLGDSTITDRNERREIMRRRARDARNRPAGRSSGYRAPTPTTVVGKIMEKQASGQPLTQAERQTLSEYRAGRGRGGGPSSGSKDLIGQVYVRGGKRVQYSKKAGAYVDLATGQRVQ